MPADLRAAHEPNDETLERICLGRRFKNDTERLEKLSPGRGVEGSLRWTSGATGMAFGPLARD